MQTILRNMLAKLTTALLLVTAMFSGLTPTMAYAACAPTVSFDLYAKTGSQILFGSTSVTIWGYSSTSGGTASIPGPMLDVNEGDCVGVTLHNVDIPGSTSLLFQGQSMVPDTTGVSGGGSVTYTFTAGDPGTFLYEAGLTPNGQHQVAMGMYGALVVRPSGAPSQAYADPSTAFDAESVVVLSEYDTALASAPTAFDMRKYAPKYFLINGKAYPGTASIFVAAGDDVLLRYVNAGLTSHHMSVLGLSQTLLGQDGVPFSYSRKVVSETIAPGQTLDALVTIPALASSKYALYDSNLMLRNNTGTGSYAGFGGMLTFLTVGTPPPPGPDVVGPTTTSVVISPNPANGTSDVTVTASVSDVTSGGTTIQAAEFYVDSTLSSPTVMTADTGFDTSTESVTGTLPTVLVGALATGNHTIYVRGQDSAGNWGLFSQVVLKVDQTPPTVISPSLSPNPANGSVNVSMTATATDSATGNSNITAAEYWIDSGAPVSMTVSVSAPVSGISATIPAAAIAALTAGPHTVHIHSMDALNAAWGSDTTLTLNVDKTGPVTSGVSALPSPNNGTKPFNSTVQAVRVTATFTDADANIVAGEGFIDTIGATGTGFVFTATDGIFNSLTETGRADIPLAVTAPLSEGDHTIYVHGKDAAGNWGAMETAILEIDKTPPIFTGISFTPNPTLGAASVTMTVLGASDPVSNGNTSGVVGGEYWVGTTNPAPGGGTAFSGLTSSISTNLLPAGTSTIRARVRDGADNWSTVIQQASITVTHQLYFSTFGNANPPGVGGTADDADIYFYNGSTFSRNVDVTAITNPLPAGANVDGFDRVDATHFYMSFAGDTTIVLPGPDLTVQDEDIVYYDAGTWSVYFDGTARGLTVANLDIDAFNIAGGVLYFSTVGNTYPPTLAGCTAISGEAADDADIYSWNGSCFARVWTAVTVDMPGAADVDGLVFVDASHFYLSFVDNISIPGLGTVQDEDVVYYNNGAWMVYFDGTSIGLTNNNHDIDAFDLP